MREVESCVDEMSRGEGDAEGVKRTGGPRTPCRYVVKSNRRETRRTGESIRDIERGQHGQRSRTMLTIEINKMIDEQSLEILRSHHL